MSAEGWKLEVLQALARSMAMVVCLSRRSGNCGDDHCRLSCSFSHVLLSKDYHLQEMKIPKIIMQQWNDENIPEKWKCSPESIKKHMPGWKYILTTMKDWRDLIKNEYPQYLRRYDSFRHHIQRVDFFRYAWLHKHGGLYMDLDFEVMEPLDRFFEEGSLFFLPMHGNMAGGANSFMASVPNHPFWIKLMDSINQTDDVTYFSKFDQVLHESGPIAVEHALQRNSFSWTVLPKEIRPGPLGDPTGPQGALRTLEGRSWVNHPWVIDMEPYCKCAVMILVVIVVFFLASRCRNIIIVC